MAQFQLNMHAGPTPGKTYPLDADVVTIGREAGNTIIINDAEVSRKHASLSFQGGKYVIEDNGSTNGTFVNGSRIMGQHVMKQGEVISFGEKINLVYETLVDPNATVLSSKPPVIQQQQARPAFQEPAPQKNYVGSVPAGQSAPDKPKNKRTPLIIAGVVLLCAVCACGAFLYYAPQSFWCMLPIDWGAGACG